VKDEREHIDNVYKDAAEKQSFSVPDSFLKDLDGRLDEMEGKAKRKGLWWLMVLPIGICAFLYFNSKTNETLPANSINPVQDSVKKDVAIEVINDYNSSVSQSSMDEKANSLSEETNILKIPSVTFNIDETKNVKKGFEDIYSNENDISDGEALQEIVPSSSKNQNPLSNQKTQVKIHKAVLAQEANGEKVIFSENIQSGKEPLNSMIQNEMNSANIASGLPKSIEGKKDIVVDSLSVVPVPTKVASTDSLLGNNVVDSVVIMSTEDNADFNENDTVTQLDSIVDLKSKDVKAIELESDDKSKNWVHEIQLYAGMVNSSPLLGFAAENASEQMTVNELSLWSTSYAISYRAGINDFDFGIGIGFLKNGEKVNYPTNSLNEFTIDSSYFMGFEIDSIYINQNWEIDSIPVYVDSSYVISINDTNSFTGKNVYSWINIPLDFGYRFELGEYVFIPRLGVDLGFASGVNIGTYAESTGGGFVERASNRFILSYSLHLEIRRSFNRFHVFVNPYFRSNVMPVISSDIQRRRYHSMGINAGIGFRLNP
jgi:hypothetical protein